MRVLHAQSFPRWIRELFQVEFTAAGIDVIWYDDISDTPWDTFTDVEVLLTSKQYISKEMMSSLPSLKLIQVQGRAPWAVDWMAAREVGIPVSVLPHRGAIAVAEQTISLMLGCYRRLVDGHLGTRDGEYLDLDLDPIETNERKIAFNWLKFDDVQQLYGKTLGLVGLGDIGIEVSRRAQAFDMEILYTKRHPLLAEHEHQANVRYVGMEELLQTSDFVSLHAPHTSQTEKMINTKALDLMKSSAVLINTARGGLVDEEALVSALQEGRIGGAGLDAFLYEPLPQGHPLVDCPKVLFSPHVGGGTGGGQKGMMTDVINNLDSLRSKSELKGLVDV